MRRADSSAGKGSAFARETAFFTAAYSRSGSAVSSWRPSTSSPEVVITGTPKRAAERAMICVSVRSTPFTRNDGSSVHVWARNPSCPARACIPTHAMPSSEASRPVE
jgi:hypothetical protein